MSFLSGLARGAVAAAMILLSACTRNDSCVAIPTVANVPVILAPTLVSPAPGATGVSTGPLDVTIGSANGVSALFLKDTGGNFTTPSNFRPANPPSNDVRIGTFAQLASHTTYQVYVNVIVSGPTNFSCSPNAQIVTTQNVLLGSFTTG